MDARRWQWTGIWVGLALFGVLALDDVTHGPVYSIDRPIYDKVGQWNATGLPVHPIGKWVSYPASVPVAIVITAIVVTVWYFRQARRLASWALGSSIVVAAIIAGLKFTFRRPLPPIIQNAWYGYSFPSGHTIGAVSNLGILIFLGAQVHVDCFKLSGAEAKRTWHLALAVWITVSLATAIARILSQEHWTSDVFAGLALGTALTCATLLLAKVPNRSE